MAKNPDTVGFWSRAVKFLLVMFTSLFCCLHPCSLRAADGSWGVDNAGAWSASNNWYSVVATGISQYAYFTNAITADRYFWVDSSPWTIGHLTFSSPNFNWSVTSGGTLNLAVGSGQPQITVITNNFFCGTTITGYQGFVKAGIGGLFFTNVNTYSGPTVVSNGIIYLTGIGTLGASSNVDVWPSAQIMILNGAASNTIADNAVVNLRSSGTYGTMFLTNGVNETVGALSFNFIGQSNGTWGSSASSATFTDDNYFSGPGILNVLNAPSNQITRFVSLTGTHVFPYTNWVTAATNIQYAIDACSAGDSVIVTNGIYYVSSQISITNDIFLGGVSEAYTCIDGGNTTRCLFVNSPGAVVDGFTLTHGRTLSGSDYGGGVMVTNGLVRRCIIIENTSADTGGGVSCYSNGILESCLIVSNETHYGGGVYLRGGLMRNCTVVDNVATSSGGGGVVIDMNGQVWNSVLCNNLGGMLGTNYCINSGQINYTCIFPDYDPAPGGTSNIFVNPLFVGGGSYRLQAVSPCLDSGTNQAWMVSSAELDGNARIVNTIVDRGCYEYSGGGPEPSVMQDFDTWPGAPLTIGTYTNSGWVINLCSVATNTPADHTLPYVCSMYTGGAAFVRSPFMPDGISSISFNMRNDFAASNHTINVETSPDGTNWTLRLVVTNTFDIWNMQNCQINEPSGGYVRLLHTTPPGGYLVYIDDISIWDMSAPQVNYFVLSGLPAYSFTNQYITFTLQAWQGTNLWTNYTGTVNMSASSGGTTIPPSYTFQTSDLGVKIFTNGLVYNESAHHWFDVMDTTNSSMFVHGSIVIFNGAVTGTAARMDVTGIRDPITTGQVISVSVAAVDNNFNLVTNFAGQVNFTSSDGTASLPSLGSGNWSYAINEGGWRTFTNDLVFNTVGEHWFKAEWQTDTNVFGTMYDITVQGNGFGTNATHLALNDVQRYCNAGETMSIWLEARDEFERVFTNFTGSVVFSSSDSAVVFTGGSNVVMSGADHGEKWLNNFVQFNTPGTHWLRAEWVGNSNVYAFVNGIEVNTVTGAPPVWLDMELQPNSEIALKNDWMTVKVSAKTTGGAIETNYSATVLFTSSDGGANLPGSYTFTPADEGVHVFSNALRFSAAGKQDISVEEQGNPVIKDMFDVWVMSSGATNTTSFMLDASSPTMLSNFWYDVTIVACGDGKLVNTNFNGTVLFSSTDPLATFTFVNFSSFSNGIGRISSQATMRTPGQQTIKATYLSDTNVFGEMNTFVLGGGTYYYVNNAFGSDTNNGLSTNTPFETITRGYSSAGPGDVIIVGGGKSDYTNNIVVPSSGLPGQWIGLVGDIDSLYFGSGDEPRIRPASGSGIEAGSCSYLVFSGLEIAECSTGIVVNGGSNIAILDCYISGNINAIYASGATDLVMIENTIESTTNIAVELNTGCHNAIFENNEILSAYNGVRILNSTNVVVSGNQMANVTYVTLTINDTSSGDIGGNSIKNSGATAIALQSPAMNTVWANIHHNIISGGGEFAIKVTDAASGVQIINNTIADNVGGIDIDNSANLLLKNNIIAGQISIGVRATTTNGLVATYNDVFGSLTNWAMAASPGIGCISSSPLFAGPDDYHLQSTAGRPTPDGFVFDATTSPCSDTGDPGDTVTKEPMPNGGQIDMGAYGNTEEASISSGALNHDIMVIGPINGTISPSGTVWVANGSNMIFSIIPDPNYHITDVTVDGTNNIGATNSYTFINVTNGGHMISATFAIDEFSLSVNVGGNGSVNPSGTVLVAYDGSINFSITSDPNNHITRIITNGADVIGSPFAANSTTATNFNWLNIVAAGTFGVNFAQDIFTFSATSPFGTPTPAGIITNTYNALINASVANSPTTLGNTQYLCTGWTGIGNVTGGSGTNTSFNITVDSTIEWMWATNYWLTTTAGIGGAVDVPSSWVLAGSNLFINAVPTNGYSFAGWTGDVVTNDNPLFLTAATPLSVMANFTLSTYDVMAMGTIDGTISPSGTSWVAHGSNILYTFVPATNCHIVDVMIDGFSVGASNSYNFINVTNGGHFIDAIFAPDTYTLNVTSIYGSPFPSGLTTNNWNDPVNAWVDLSVPDGTTTQYVCIGWTGTGSVPASGISNSMTFNITSDSLIAWNWQTQYWLNVLSGPNGSVDVASDWTNAGANAVITASPSSGYHFAGWTGDVPPAQTNDISLTLTMNQARSITANFDLSIGSICVIINPTNANSMGAQWQMTTGPDTAWHTNGFLISGVPGDLAPYTITFNTVAAFTKPVDMTNISITHSATTTVTATYFAGNMILIPGGTFMMGMTASTNGHQVTLSDFYIDVKEVTVGDFLSFCADTGNIMPPAPSWGWTNTNLPMVNVSWNLASAYSIWAGKRLVTEAEYEYVMRSGIANQLYPWGNTIGAGNANYFGNVGLPTNGGSYPANSYGVFDIAGNIWEWCGDWYESAPVGPVTNPTGPGSGSGKVCRGGSWASSPFTLQCAPRYNIDPSIGYSDLGFRCAATAASGGAPKNNAGSVADIPEWWIQYYFGLDGSFDPNADSDNDGMKDKFEYLAGTDPRNADSALKVKGMNRPDGSDFTIQWSSSSGKKYRVERASSLMEGFMPVITNISATPPVNSYTDSADTGASYFYRIKVE